MKLKNQNPAKKGGVGIKKHRFFLRGQKAIFGQGTEKKPAVRKGGEILTKRRGRWRKPFMGGKNLDEQKPIKEGPGLGRGKEREESQIRG